MQKVKAGDIDRLSLLYERYKKPLFAYFYRLCSDKDKSEDMVQTVFYKILKNRKQYKAKGKFTSWMFSIAHNIMYDNFRKKENKNILSDMNEYDRIDDTGNVMHEIEKKEQLQILKTALSKLDISKREPLIMCKYQNLKYKEIGEILNLSEGAVKVRVFRALDELKEIYLEIEKTQSIQN